MTKDFNTEVFFDLVRMGIGHHASSLPNDINWNVLDSIAEQQGLSAIVVDGIELLPKEKQPPKELLLQWIGETLQSYEYRYELYCSALAELAAFYNNHGFKMMVLKGYGCGIYWPKPEHRPCGDIDIWLFGKQKESDALLEKIKGVSIDTKEQHHTVFVWKDFVVENHYDFINIHHHKSNKELEKIFKELGKDDTNYIELYGERVFLPSPNLQALFLYRHAIAHFAAEGLVLRQLLDIAFFVKINSEKVDWHWVLNQLDTYGLRVMFNVFNAICVEELGFESIIFPQVQFCPILKARVLSDILNPEFPSTIPNGIISRVIYKWRRWRGNAWKHKLCYKESMWSAFWTGLWNHILKPSSI